MIAAITRVVDAVEHPAPLFRQINEYLLRAHETRFKAQKAPDGTPWQALTPAYWRRKRKNKDKVLTLNGYLRGTLRGQVSASGLEFGTNVIYGAIHQFGGEIKKQARVTTLHFMRASDGSVGNRFAKKSRSN